MIKHILAALFFLIFLGDAASAQIGGYSSFPTGPTTLTDGATITVPCPGVASSGVYYLTLTGANHKIVFPSCPITSNGIGVRFYISAGNNSGAAYNGLVFSPSSSGGFNWTNNIPYGVCTGNGTAGGGAAPAITDSSCLAAAAADNIDELGCDVIGATSASVQWNCWTTQRAIAPPFLPVASASCSTPDGSAGCTTTAANMTGATALFACIGYINTAPTFADSASNSYTTIFTKVGTSNVSTELLYVQAPTVSGSMTFTVGSGTAPAIAVMGFPNTPTSPLDQTPSPATGSSVTTLQPGSITPGQANELLLTCLSYDTFPNNSTPTINAPFTLGSSRGYVSGGGEGVGLAYQIQTTARAQNPTWSFVQSGIANAGIISVK